MSYPTHSGRECHHFGSYDLSQWLSLSASTSSSVEKGEWSAQYTCPGSLRSEDECHPHGSLGHRPYLSLRPFSGIVLCGVTEATSLFLSPSPTPGTSVHMLPSDSALPTPSLPWCSLSPQFLLMHPLSLTVIYFSSHCLFPPIFPLPQNSSGHPNEAGLPAAHVLGSHAAGGCDGGQFRVRGLPSISMVMRGWHCQTTSPAATLPLSLPARPLSALLDLSSAFLSSRSSACGLSLWSQPSPPSSLSA